LSDAKATHPAPPRRSLRRWIVAAAIGVALLGAGLFALRAGVGMLERQVASALGPGAQVGHLGADWNGVEISDLRIAAPGGWPAPETLRAERVRLVPSWRSLFSKRIEIARIEVTGGYLSALRTRDGHLRLLPTLIGSGDASRTNAQPTANAAATLAAAHPSARSVSIGEIRIENGALELFDETVARPPWKVRLQQIDATVWDLVAPAASGPLPFEISAELDGPQRDGRVALSGWLDPSTRDLELTGSLRAVDLLALQPYFVEAAKQRLSGGALDLDITAKVRSKRLHAPGRLTLSQLDFAKGGSAKARVLGVPRDLLFAGMQAKGGKISLDFSLDGDIDDPKFSLREMLATRIEVQLAKELGFSVGGLVEGIGGLGHEGLEGADKAAGGIGSALRRLMPDRK
jgi:hypothetical protein